MRHDKEKNRWAQGGTTNCLEEKDVESAVPFETAADARPQVHRKEKWNFAVPQTGVHVHRLRPGVMVSEGERGPPATSYYEYQGTK